MFLRRTGKAYWILWDHKFNFTCRRICFYFYQTVYSVYILRFSFYEFQELRAPNSLSTGNSTESNLKEGWRLEGSEDKKDRRRIASDSDSSRRWREEERETSLLSGRRDRRKPDRRVDNVSVRETIENRALPPSDRWTDGSNRNSGLETRRDSKWSTRWGPEDKEKESRTEKRTESEKEDVHIDNQTGIVNNRAASDRDSDSRDKWRPRHRMEVHSAGPASYRAAPGFGLEKGWTKGSNMGFTVGRGRSNSSGRASSGGPIGAVQFDKNESVPGKPSLLDGTFCYPRGKLLDIYRRQKFDSAFTSMPANLDEVPSITEVGILEPLAFVSPDAEEEVNFELSIFNVFSLVLSSCIQLMYNIYLLSQLNTFVYFFGVFGCKKVILKDIGKGKITSSEVVYNSNRKGRQYENITGN